jgi:hypothetical protein
MTAETLLQKLRISYGGFGRDDGARKVVQFLVALVVASRSKAPLRTISSLVGIQISSGDPGGLIKSLYQLVPSDHVFRQAAVMTLPAIENRTRERSSLFNKNCWQMWRDYDGSNFCDLARLFYSHLNEVTFSAILAEAGLRMDDVVVERFSREMSVITRAFSARWFNACARYQTPEPGSIDWYLAHCLGKLDLELERETKDWNEPIGRPWRRKRLKAPQLAL